jgi:hypothetical protein
MNWEHRCPRCHAERMRTWDELSDEEREVVKRLAESAGYKEAERQRMHRWCTRCWYEATRNDERSA